MKNIFKLLTATVIIAFASCDKAADLPFYSAGIRPTLAASNTNIAPAAADADKAALTLSWSSANHAVTPANVKYTVEIDSAGKNFFSPLTKVITGATAATFTGRELNDYLINRGYALNSTVTLDVRVTSSYANNNESLSTDVLRIQYTIYKVPPKVALPASNRLFIVGGATVGGWSNPVPVPSQELTRINENSWGGIFQLIANQSYLLLPVNGSWSAKYGTVGANNSNNPVGGDFIAGGGDLLAPATSGLYKMIFDFLTGKFTVTPFVQQHGLPSDLFIVGDATPGDWSNPVPLPSQRFTRVTSTKFELTIALTAGRKYLLLPENGNWGKKFGLSGAATNTKLSGTLAPEGGDMPSPDVSGTYKITVDFLDNSYNLVKI